MSDRLKLNNMYLSNADRGAQIHHLQTNEFLRPLTFPTGSAHLFSGSWILCRKSDRAISSSINVCSIFFIYGSPRLTQLYLSKGITYQIVLQTKVMLEKKRTGVYPLWPNLQPPVRQVVSEKIDKPPNSEMILILPLSNHQLLIYDFMVIQLQRRYILPRCIPITYIYIYIPLYHHCFPPFLMLNQI